MVFGDITDVYRTQGSYTPSCVLSAKFRPLNTRGQKLADQTPVTEFPARRNAGDANLDLWLDGTIYPQNPRMKAPPPFRDLNGLLCYVVDGADGLLGYANALIGGNNFVQCCEDLLAVAESLHVAKRTAEAQLEAERSARQCDILQFQEHVSAVESRHHAADLLARAHIQRLNADIALHVADKVRHIQDATVEVETLTARNAQEAEQVRSRYKTKISELKLELLKSQNNLGMSQLRCNRLSNSQRHTIGKRQRKDLSQLVKGGGHAKRVKNRIR